MKSPGLVRVVRLLRNSVPADYLAASIERAERERAQELRAAVKSARRLARKYEAAPATARYWRARAERNAVELAALVKARRARQRASR
jgi:hypothetical protein